MPENKEDLYTKFAHDICKIKKWGIGDQYFPVLMDGILKGQWNPEFKIWLAGRQSLMNELKTLISKVKK